MSVDTNDWQALSADWQRQETPRIDLDALRREATRRGRSLRWTAIFEMLITVLVVLACAWVVTRTTIADFERHLFVGLGVFMIGYQAWILWIRRQQWSAQGLDGASLVTLELRRAHTVQNYWRWGMWSSVLIWVVLYALCLTAMAQGGPMFSVRGMATSLALNIVVLPVVGIYGVWRCRQARDRVARLEALREQLRGP